MRVKVNSKNEFVTEDDCDFITDSVYLKHIDDISNLGYCESFNKSANLIKMNMDEIKLYMNFLYRLINYKLLAKAVREYLSRLYYCIDYYNNTENYETNIKMVDYLIKLERKSELSHHHILVAMLDNELNKEYVKLLINENKLYLDGKLVSTDELRQHLYKYCQIEQLKYLNSQNYMNISSDYKKEILDACKHKNTELAEWLVAQNPENKTLCKTLLKNAYEEDDYETAKLLISTLTTTLSFKNPDLWKSYQKLFMGACYSDTEFAKWMISLDGKDRNIYGMDNEDFWDICTSNKEMRYPLVDLFCGIRN